MKPGQGLGISQDWWHHPREGVWEPIMVLMRSHLGLQVMDTTWSCATSTMMGTPAPEHLPGGSEVLGGGSIEDPRALQIMCLHLFKPKEKKKGCYQLIGSAKWALYYHRFLVVTDITFEATLLIRVTLPSPKKENLLWENWPLLCSFRLQNCPPKLRPIPLNTPSSGKWTFFNAEFVLNYHFSHLTSWFLFISSYFSS